MSNSENHLYEFGEFRLDTAERLLLRNGEPVSLPPKVFETLVVLVQNSGHLLDKEKLMRELWPDAFVEEVNLSVNISALRKTLGESENGPRYVETVPKRGYRFVADVRELEDDDLVVHNRIRARIVSEEVETRTAAEQTERAPARYEQSVTMTISPEVNRRRKIMPVVLAASVLVLGLVLASAYFRNSIWKSPAPSAKVNSVASFSLENFGWEKLSANDKSYGIISPDGEFLVYFTEEGKGTWSMLVRRLASTETVTVLSHATGTNWGGTLSHNSTFFYFIRANQNGATGTLYRLSILGGTTRKILERINGGPTLSPDDSRVAFIRYNFKAGVSALITANTNDGSDERVLEESDAGPELFAPAWAPDGLQILCIKGDRRSDGTYWSLVEIPAGGGPVAEITEPKRQRLWGQAWLPDGSGVVVIASDPASAKQQLYAISYPGGLMRRITNDLNSYDGITISSDGAKLVTNQLERQSDIWIASANNISQAGKITALGVVDRLAWTPDGRIVYDALKEGKRHLWLSDADGSHQEQVSGDNDVDWSPSVSRDGRYLVFLSTRGGSREIWRTDGDGRNPRQLTNTGLDLRLPRIALDGQMVYFSCYEKGRWVLARVPIDGGELLQVTDVETDLWDLSPDGKRLAYSFYDEKMKLWRVAVGPLESQGPVTYLDFVPHNVLLWTPDGASLIYSDTNPQYEPDSTLWRQPLSGEKPEPFVVSTPDINYWASWSPDGQHLAIVRGKQVTNIVMLKQSIPR